LTGYVLTEAAESDLREIVRYTHKQWGNAQARSYVNSLKNGISSLANGRGVFKDMSAIFPALRMGLYEHHYVFCLPRDVEPALVVAIFHKRMDLMTRLTERLKD